MAEFLSKEEIKQWRSSLEKITLEEFAARLGKEVAESRPTNDLIDIIVGAEDVKASKPNPEGLLWTLERLGLKKEEVLYVGDSYVDAKTAENANVGFAAVLTGTTTREEFSNYNCMYIGEDIKDVYNYILTLK